MSSGRHLVVITAPSGSGKTTVARAILQSIPQMVFSVSATTRAPRPHEKDGVHYHFLSKRQFQEHVAGGDLLEYEEVYPGKYYGTLRAEVERAAVTAPVLLDVDVKGALSVKRRYRDDALTIFLKAPSIDVLSQRLQRRGTEDPAALAERIAKARDELGYEDQFDAVVINDDLQTAIAETLQHVQRFLQA